MKSCFCLSLHSSHSTAITALPSGRSIPGKQLSIIPGLCHTQKACSTSLMVYCGWCGKDTAQKEQIWRNIWEWSNDVFRWLERLGWAANINNVCVGAPKHKLEFASVLCVLNHLDETIPKQWPCEWDHWQADFPPLAWGCFLHLMFSDKV